jgi:hypothetical protein
MCLAAVFNDREGMALGHATDRGHAGRLSVQVHRNDRACS